MVSEVNLLAGIIIFLNTIGRIEVIKSSIYPMVLFWTQVCQLPNNVIDKIEALCANFIWNNKKHKVAWKQLCLPKDKGGVGLKDIRTLQQSMAIKLIWLFLNRNSLWANWMPSRYLKNKNFWCVKEDNNSSYTWKMMLRQREYCKQLFSRCISNGKDTDLLFDPWIHGKDLTSLIGWQNINCSLLQSRKVDSLISDYKWELNDVFLPLNLFIHHYFQMLLDMNGQISFGICQWFRNLLSLHTWHCHLSSMEGKE